MSCTLPAMTDRAEAALRPPLPPGLWVTGLGLAAGNLGALAMLAMNGVWPFDADGQPLATDFVTFYAAARAALEGHAAQIYDSAFAKAVEDAVLGHGFSGSYGWYYPPPFLLAVAPLALLAYLPAQLLWTGTTLAACLTVAARIGGAAGALALLAFPAALSTIFVGQNGFVSAALLGGALVAMGRRPVLAGILLGCLTYKPHLGLLVPLALAAGGHWRAFGAAALSALALALLSYAVLGAEPWMAFLGTLGGTGDTLLSQGAPGFAKLQSVYGLLRHLGANVATAWTAQGLVTASCAAAVIVLWRRRLPFELQAAGLIAAVALATPYLYLYDLPLLAMAIAFLLRQGADRAEMVLLALAALAIYVYPAVEGPLGLAASLSVALLVARRMRRLARPEGAAVPATA
jgi:arabinofuranan 3-O-arabinosyltransferase